MTWRCVEFEVCITFVALDGIVQSTVNTFQAVVYPLSLSLSLSLSHVLLLLCININRETLT